MKRGQQHQDDQPVAWFTPDELASRWKISSDTVIRLVKRGELRGKKIGGQWRIPGSAVDEYEREEIDDQSGEGHGRLSQKRHARFASSSDPWGIGDLVDKANDGAKHQRRN